MINHKDHWKNIYKKNNFKNFSWYQEKPNSIKLIDNWLEGDITTIDLPKNHFNVWHDRAVFHFLTERSDRVNYINQILKSTRENGYVIISVFSYEGPKTCSSLPVKQYDENSLSSELGGSFEILKFSYHDHLTPTNKKQNFISCCFKIINKK